MGAETWSPLNSNWDSVPQTAYIVQFYKMLKTPTAACSHMWLCVGLSMLGVIRCQCISETLDSDVGATCFLPVSHVSPAVQRIYIQRLSQERVKPPTIHLQCPAFDVHCQVSLYRYVFLQMGHGRGNDFSVRGAKIGEKQWRQSNSKYNFLQYVCFRKMCRQCTMEYGAKPRPQKLGNVREFFC